MGNKEVRGVVHTCTQVRPEPAQILSLEGVGFGNRAFDAGYIDTSLPGMKVLLLEERHLRRTEAVMIGERKERAILRARDDCKEPAHLVW